MLSKSEFKPFKVIDIQKLNHNTSLFRMDLGEGNTMGMTTAGLMMVQGVGKDGKTMARPYTPTTRDSNTTGHFDLVIKKYEQGNVSAYVHGLQIGDQISVKGCFTKLEIKPNMKKEIGLIAGGSGLTPMLQVVEELLESSDDQTKLSLLFCNQTLDDIVLQDRLDALAAKYPRFKVHYCVDQGDADWSGLTGYVTADMIKGIMPEPSPDNMIMVCGPPPMYKAICGPKKFEKGKPPAQGEVGGFMKSMGYTEDMVFKF
jgi:cytochrome-b5 reductase